MKDPISYRMYDYDRRLLPNAHLRVMDASTTDQESAIEHTGLSVGYPGWGLLYYLVLTSIPRGEPATLIETGTNIGCSTIMLAQALHDAGGGGCVHTVEIDPERFEQAGSNLSEAGVDHLVKRYLGGSTQTLPGVLADLDAVHVAFLDGAHDEPTVLEEFALVHPKLAEGALVVFDNTYPIADEGEDQRVYGALKTISSRYGGNLVYLDYVSWFTPGVAIWQQTPTLRR